MKEISYIHSEAYASGELKHGTILLVSNGTPVIALAGDESVIAKTNSNIREVQARGAKTIAVTLKSLAENVSGNEAVFAVPDVGVRLMRARRAAPVSARFIFGAPPVWFLCCILSSFILLCPNFI